MSKVRIAAFIISMSFATYFIASGVLGLGSIAEYNNAVEEEKIAKQELEQAEKNLAYGYGKCVFYDQISVDECNAAAPEGLAMYEKYYGDGSWTIGGGADPDNGET